MRIVIIGRAAAGAGFSDGRDTSVDNVHAEVQLGRDRPPDVGWSLEP